MSTRPFERSRKRRRGKRARNRPRPHTVRDRPEVEPAWANRKSRSFMSRGRLIVSVGVGIFHAGQNRHDFEVNAPEGRFPQRLDDCLISSQIPRLPNDDVGDFGRIKLCVIKAHLHRGVLRQDRLDRLAQECKPARRRQSEPGRGRLHLHEDRERDGVLRLVRRRWRDGRKSGEDGGTGDQEMFHGLLSLRSGLTVRPGYELKLVLSYSYVKTCYPPAQTPATAAV